MSTYYLDEAYVEVTRQLFTTYEANARRLVERKLPLPAHSYVLKCSHAFNIPDSRGAVRGLGVGAVVGVDASAGPRRGHVVGGSPGGAWTSAGRHSGSGTAVGRPAAGDADDERHS
jgi:hypothetical protein